MALLQESLTVAVKTGAMKPQDTCRVVVDTTVQRKNVMFPTDAKLIHRARERLVALAKRVGLDLRQSYVRVGKNALIAHQRYAQRRCPATPMTATPWQMSFPTSKKQSAIRSAASWPMQAIAATTHPTATSSGSSPPGRSVASLRRSSARCAAARRSSR